MAQTFLSGLALGAGLIWFLDPRRGGQRRAIVRDKMKHVAHELEEAARVGGHDLVNRVEGVRAEIGATRRPTPVDTKLEERVRSELGRICSHTRAIHVRAEGHRVHLEGPVLAAEADEIVRRVARLRGVQEVENHLEAHTEAHGVPALQGEHIHHHPRRLSPAAHLVLG
jgi:BON domain